MTSLTVLVVEDETLIAEIIRIYLEERGHKMVGNPISYDEAVAGIITLKPDIVLLDIRLYGDKSGLDVAAYLRKHQPDLPFMFLELE